MIPALTPQEMPSDFAELLKALVAVRAIADAAVEVHDQRVATRLVYLNLAEVVPKGLRGSATLQSLFEDYGAEVVSQLMLTEVPLPVQVEEPSDKTTTAPAPSETPEPPTQRVGDAQSPVPPLSAFLTREQIGDEPLAMPASSMKPSPVPSLPVQARAVAAPSRLADETRVKVAPPSLPETEASVVDRAEEELARARAIREELTRLTRELHSVLQPVTDTLLGRNSIEELQHMVALYPASLQRNAILARISELSEKQ